MTMFLSGFLGLVVLITASAAGIFAPTIGISRSHAMGCLMVPVILFFVG